MFVAQHLDLWSDVLATAGQCSALYNYCHMFLCDINITLTITVKGIQDFDKGRNLSLTLILTEWYPMEESSLLRMRAIAITTSSIVYSPLTVLDNTCPFDEPLKDKYI